MTPSRRHGLILFVGILLAQAAWILAVPPFRGMDEFDHAYRAAGVARGDWLLTDVAQNGRGLLATIPADLEHAARPQCERMPYTLPDNCRSVESRGRGTVRIATGVAPYNPLYYLLVGTAALPFEGASSLYVMRIASALFCAIGLAMAWLCLAGTGRSWTRLGFLLALTPTVVYSSTIAAPNGLEIVSGMLLWSALLALISDPVGRRGARMIAVAVVAGCCLALLRPLGPVWGALIIVAVGIFSGQEALRNTWTAQRRLLLAAGGCATAAGLAAAGWTWISGFAREAGGSDPPPIGVDFAPVTESVRWTLQIVAAFPYRDQPAPMPVYPLVLLVVAVLLWTGVRRASGSQRVAIVLAMAMTVIVPLVLTFVTMAQIGNVWQGRYALPFVVGIPVLCGLVLDRSRWAFHESPRLLALAIGMLAVAHVTSVVHVLQQERGSATSAADAGWVQVGPVEVCLMMTGAWLLMLGWLSVDQSRPREKADSRS